MAQVFTLTANLLAQTYASFGSVKEGGTFRAKTESFSVGGKGINVSKALKQDGVESFCVFFYGGQIGEKCREYLQNVDKLNCLAIKCSSETRTGLVVFNDESKKETTFLGLDANLGDDEFLFAISEIEKRANPNDILAFCGSCPDWSKVKFEALKSLISKKNLRLVLDTYGAPLKDFFYEQLEILKINADEFFAFSLIEKSEESLDEKFSDFAKKCKAKYFAITNSSKPVRASLNSKILKIAPPKIDGQTYETGCGDIVLASLISALLKSNKITEMDLEDAIIRASKKAKYREN